MKTYGLYKDFPYEGDIIKFKASVGLLPLYKSLFGRDLIDDMVTFMNGSKRFARFIEEQGDIEKEVTKYRDKLDAGQELSEEELARLEALDTELDQQIQTGDGLGISTDFIGQIMCALALNAVPETDRPGMPEALDVIPLEFTMREDVISEAIKMILPFADIKKK